MFKRGWGGLIEDLQCPFLFPIIEQANLGMIFSPQKSVGKSLSAKMLAYAQGVPGRWRSSYVWSLFVRMFITKSFVTGAMLISISHGWA